VAFDSCNVSLIEGAYELRGSADYLVASQFSLPLPGWPYYEILWRVMSGRDHFAGENGEGPKDFGRAIVSQFVRHYAESASVTMTMLDLSTVDEFNAAIGNLADELLMAAKDDQGEQELLEELFQRSQVPDPKNREGQPSVDLATFCWNLVNFSGSESVRVAAADIGDLLLFPGDVLDRRQPFIVAHARNDLVVSMLQGVSIFAPNVVSQNESDLRTLRSKYQRLQLAQSTNWDELVFALAEPD
jgi:hypothetical protein